MFKRLVCAFALISMTPTACMQLTKDELLKEIRPHRNCLYKLPFSHVVTIESTKNRTTYREIYKVDLSLNSNSNTFVFAARCGEYPTEIECFNIQSSITTVLKESDTNSKKAAIAIHDVLRVASKSAKGDAYSLGCIALRPRSVYLSLSYKHPYHTTTLVFSGKDVTEHNSKPCECPEGSLHNEIITILSMHDTGAVAFLNGIHRIRRSEIVLEAHQGDISDSLARLHEESRTCESKNTTSIMYMTAAAYLCAHDKENN